jgi:hypothetical protein
LPSGAGSPPRWRGRSRPSPKLVVSNTDVPRRLTKLLERAPGQRVKFIDVCQTYAAMCRAEGK